jgi:peroxiredoxin Q/BCP
MPNTTIRQWLRCALLTLFSGPLAADLKPGDAAPGFELLDQYSNSHKLSDYRGKWLVLYFYPKDDTPGCTTEACEFRDDVSKLRQMGVALLGVSTDDVKSHKEFAEKYHLPFSLLSDAGGDVARSYGSLTNLGLWKFAKRHTFVIGPDGRIARVYRDVKPQTHSDQVIADLKALRGQRE